MRNGRDFRGRVNCAEVTDPDLELQGYLKDLQIWQTAKSHDLSIRPCVATIVTRNCQESMNYSGCAYFLKSLTVSVSFDCFHCQLVDSSCSKQYHYPLY